MSTCSHPETQKAAFGDSSVSDDFKLDAVSEKTKKAKAKKALNANAGAIYQAYPRKVGKGNALGAISRALEKISFEELLKAVQEFAKSDVGKAADNFTPHPATWFNQERWTDDRKTWKRNTYQQTSSGNSAAFRSEGYSDEIAATIARNNAAAKAAEAIPVGDESGSEPCVENAL